MAYKRLQVNEKHFRIGFGISSVMIYTLKTSQSVNLERCLERNLDQISDDDLVFTTIRFSLKVDTNALAVSER